MDNASFNKVIALLPMKEHSQRIPNKNIRDFCGSPLYHKVLGNLLQSQYIKGVIIDTDSEFIARDASEHFQRVKVFMRPQKLRGDFVSMNDIIDYDILQEENEFFLQTHSTNPLLSSVTIDRAIESFFDNLGNYDSLFSVTRHQTRLYWKDARPINHNPSELLRTQDLEPVYEENSNIYIFSKASFFDNEKKRIGKRPIMFEIDKLEAADIDEESDFKLAELIYNMYHK